jgi:hypothetical protein
LVCGLLVLCGHWHGHWGVLARGGARRGQPLGLGGYMVGHSLLRRLLLCHVSQTVVGHNPLDWVVIFLFARVLNLRINARPSDLLVSSKLVDGEPDVRRRVLTWRRSIRLGVHVGAQLRVPRLLCAGSFFCNGRDGRRLWGIVVVGLLRLLSGNAHAPQ